MVIEPILSLYLLIPLSPIIQIACSYLPVSNPKTFPISWCMLFHQWVHSLPFLLLPIVCSFVIFLGIRMSVFQIWMFTPDACSRCSAVLIIVNRFSLQFWVLCIVILLNLMRHPLFSFNWVKIFFKTPYSNTHSILQFSSWLSFVLYVMMDLYILLI